MLRILEKLSTKRFCKSEPGKKKSGQHAPKYRSPPANEKSLAVFISLPEI